MGAVLNRVLWTHLCCLLFAGELLAVATSRASDAEPAAPEPAVMALEVYPTAVTLHGRDDRQQLLVTGVMAGDRHCDLSRDVKYRVVGEPIVTVDAEGVVRPVADGAATIDIRHGKLRAKVKVSVERGKAFEPLDFTRDVVPILTKAGCNGGNCHGKTGGRGGFQLSLFGFDPKSDYDWIVRHSFGRRLSAIAPGQSLLLLKPSTILPHGGGHRLSKDDPEYKRLERWIATGAPWGTIDADEVVRLEVTPSQQSLDYQAQQQLLVTAVYNDGSRRDVTRTTEFRSNDGSIAEVEEHGLITTADRCGETAIVCMFRGQVGVCRVLTPLPNPQAKWPKLEAANFIDEHVFAKLHELRVAPSERIDDAGFMRRASLQITGRQPSVEELKAFLGDKNPKKREQLVEQLVTSDAYADHFAQKWADILRNKRRGQGDRLPGTIAFHRWIRNALVDNMPYDQFVREIVTATGNVSVHPPAQWYAEVRALDQYVDDTAQVFLGVRIGCARCHHHPFENLSQDDYYGLAAFFARVQRKGGTGVAERRANESIYLAASGDVKHPLTGKVVPPHGLGGPPVEAAPYEDPRAELVDWMAEPDNPYFARAFVNRMWAHFFTRGLVEPLDDLRATNPASNEPLLEELAQSFVDSGYDMRAVVRLICTSTTYRLHSTPNADNLDETQSYSRFYPQRLAAEVLLDAIDMAARTPTSFEGLPAGTRAVQLPDESAGNSFLNLFGRPPRESACECERQAQPSLSQSLFLMNDSFIADKIAAKKNLAERLAADKRSTEERIGELWLAVMSRPPRADEVAKAAAYLGDDAGKPALWRDLLWALLNTKEFMYVH
jgi:hypothetical protein